MVNHKLLRPGIFLWKWNKTQYSDLMIFLLSSPEVERIDKAIFSRTAEFFLAGRKATFDFFKDCPWLLPVLPENLEREVKKIGDDYYVFSSGGWSSFPNKKSKLGLIFLDRVLPENYFSKARGNLISVLDEEPTMADLSRINEITRRGIMQNLKYLSQVDNTKEEDLSQNMISRLDLNPAVIRKLESWGFKLKPQYQTIQLGSNLGG